MPLLMLKSICPYLTQLQIFELLILLQHLKIQTYINYNNKKNVCLWFKEKEKSNGSARYKLNNYIDPEIVCKIHKANFEFICIKSDTEIPL